MHLANENTVCWWPGCWLATLLRGLRYGCQLLEGGSEESAQLDIARLASNAASLPVSAWRCCRLAMLERCGSMYNTRNIGAESHSLGAAPVSSEEVDGGGLVGPLGSSNAVGVWDMFCRVVAEERRVSSTLAATASMVSAPVCGAGEASVSCGSAGGDWSAASDISRLCGDLRNRLSFGFGVGGSRE